MSLCDLYDALIGILAVVGLGPEVELFPHVSVLRVGLSSRDPWGSCWRKREMIGEMGVSN